MKIIYLADIRLPTEKAHGFQIMKTCEALVRVGNEITLMIPSWNKATPEEIFKYYGLTQSFSIEKIPQTKFNLIKFGSIGFALRSYFFAKKAAGKLGGREFDAVYTRDEAVAVYRGPTSVFYEMHDVRKGLLQKKAMTRASGIIAISNGLKDYCVAQGIDQSKITVVPDAVDLEEFDIEQNKDDVRHRLGLPKDKKIVLYSGHLYSWKGADTLAEAAHYLDADTVVVFVGGTPWDIESFKNKYRGATSRCHLDIIGQKPHSEIPLYLKAADVLVLPNSAKEDISRLYTSPVKLFEYMASGVPIVASDLPSIREILNEECAVFAKPDDALSLAEKIKYSLANVSKAVILSNRALEEVKKYSWGMRAKHILTFMKMRLNAKQ